MNIKAQFNSKVIFIIHLDKLFLFFTIYIKYKKNYKINIKLSRLLFFKYILMMLYLTCKKISSEGRVFYVYKYFYRNQR